MAGYLRRPRVRSRDLRFHERLPFLTLNINTRRYRCPREEAIFLSPSDFIYYPKVWKGNRNILIAEILCFMNHYVSKGLTRQQQLFEASTIDDDALVQLFSIGETGVLHREYVYEKVPLRMINNDENTVSVENGRISQFSSTTIDQLHDSLWAPIDEQERESQLLQESQKQQRLDNFTYPIDKMRLTEVWSECQTRLRINDKAQLYDAIKAIEARLSVELRLNESATVNLTRLKYVLKFLRKQNIMEPDEECDETEESTSQLPA